MHDVWERLALHLFGSDLRDVSIDEHVDSKAEDITTAQHVLRKLKVVRLTN